jgi:hypothetical protein
MFRCVRNAKRAAAHYLPSTLLWRPHHGMASKCTLMTRLIKAIWPTCRTTTDTQFTAVNSPTWQSSRPYFLASRTAVQHDCLALMWRTVLAVQRRHWSPWTCRVQAAAAQPTFVCCLPLWCAAGR